MSRHQRSRLDELRELCRLWWIRTALAALLVLGCGAVIGFRLNVSRSLPLGLYRVVGESESAERGSIVIVCLPPAWGQFALRRHILGAGHCEGGSRGLGKIVLAVGGDTVEVGEQGIAVNGSPVINSRNLLYDRSGRKLVHYPYGTHLLEPDELWLFSPYHFAAFDSRYFGPVSTTDVRAVVRPAWTWSAE